MTARTRGFLVPGAIVLAGCVFFEDVRITYDDTGGDADSDTDSDTDTDADSDTDIPSLMTDCDGGKLDPATDLCWEDPPGGDVMPWSSAVSYCDDLNNGGHSDWRLPDIEELKTLLRGCQDGTATGDLGVSLCEMVPAGCVETDSCTAKSNCDWCEHDPPDGPGANGCYWDPQLGGTCGGYWSSSSCDQYLVWFGRFNLGHVCSIDGSVERNVRCVR